MEVWLVYILVRRIDPITEWEWALLWGGMNLHGHDVVVFMNGMMSFYFFWVAQHHNIVSIELKAPAPKSKCLTSYGLPTSIKYDIVE